MSDQKMRVIQYSAEELDAMDFTRPLLSSEIIKVHTAISAILHYSQSGARNEIHAIGSVPASRSPIPVGPDSDLSDDSDLTIEPPEDLGSYYSGSEAEPDVEPSQTDAVVPRSPIINDSPFPSEFPAIQSFPCSSCPKIFPTLKGRKSHSTQFCRNEKTLSPAELMVNQSIKVDRYVCQACDYTTMKRRDLIRHARSRHNVDFTQ